MDHEIRELREAGRALLEQRFGRLSAVTGQGVQRGTRFSFRKGGETCICAIKTSTLPAGRIHFPYSNGTWGSLADIDFMLYVRRAKSGIEFQFHGQKTLLNAFNKNRLAAEKGGFTNLPTWLSPDHENADRFVGSGFGKSAIWIETLDGVDAAPQESAGRPVAAMIERAKASLANELGVNPGAIEIHVRW